MMAGPHGLNGPKGVFPRCVCKNKKNIELVWGEWYVVGMDWRSCFRAASFNLTERYLLVLIFFFYLVFLLLVICYFSVQFCTLQHTAFVFVRVVQCGPRYLNILLEAVRATGFPSPGYPTYSVDPAVAVYFSTARPKGELVSWRVSSRGQKRKQRVFQTRADETSPDG